MRYDFNRLVLNSGKFGHEADCLNLKGKISESRLIHPGTRQPRTGTAG